MKRIVAIDTETTGLSPINGHRVVNIAAVEIIDGELTGNTFHSYVSPQGKKSSSGALKVHQLTDTFLATQPLFSDIAEDLFKFISGAELTFYNKQFDMAFMQAEFDRCDFDVAFSRDFESSCLMIDFADRENNGKWIKLDSACIRYGIDISQRKVHGAAIDAELAAHLYIKLHYSSEKPLSVTPHQNPREIQQTRPIPRAFKHPRTGEMIQLNHCKNPNCSNYGVTALNPRLKKTGEPKRGLGNDYKLTKTRSGISLTCKICGSSTKLINNRAFVMESERLSSIYKVSEYPCPDTALKTSPRRKKPCRNSDADYIKHPNKYILRGLNYSKTSTKSDMASQRIECRACKHQFNVPLNAQLGQQRIDLNEALFAGLVNKGVLNRLSEQLNISMALIYKKIEFFYKQCIEFDQWHINQNIGALNGSHLTLSMDRQHYLVNWSDKEDARPTKLVNTSTVDNKSRFVFASTINFDFTSDWKSIRADNAMRRDHEKPEWKRKYAQYVFSELDIQGDDVADELSLRAPTKGLLLQQTFSLMAHLEMMKPFYSAMAHACLVADDDEGFELGICLVLRELIKGGKLFPILIRADRNNASQMQDKRSWAEQILRKHGIEFSGKGKQKLSSSERRELAQKYWAATIENQLHTSGNSRSEWLVHPFPKSQHSIQLKPLVNTSEDQWVEVAENIYDSSTQGVDNYFQMIRRRINVLERPITSATNGHKWNGYASYNPKWSVMLVEILRVYNNYVITDSKKLKNKGIAKGALTPAQKIGIANRAYKINDILKFTSLSALQGRI
ncbi:exonuclease domain-containing protein [Vibrio alfacsensis]|uniref:exonuclease domain-containing protein n=1 Tax=Vibrio alfacsensis TaxID=1074311 RepID=UPI0040696991